MAAEQALKIARDRFEALEQEEKELDVAIENAQQELSRQVERENEVTANIERLKMEIESVIAENQHDYERTCQALKEVHELQSDCAQLNCQLEAVSQYQLLLYCVTKYIFKIASRRTRCQIERSR